MELKPGHNLLLLAYRVGSGDTVEDVERDVVGWLGDVIGASRSITHTALGEWSVGPANPVSVLPVTSQDVAQRADQFCRNPAATRVLLSPPQISQRPGDTIMPVLVHLDWRHSPITLADSWVSGGLLHVWRQSDNPSLTVRGTCHTPDVSAAPVDPGLSDIPGIPSVDDLRGAAQKAAESGATGLVSALRMIGIGLGVAGGGYILLALVRRKRGDQ